MANQALLKAADFLEEHNWVKYVFHNGVGGYCMLGAIDYSGGYKEFYLVRHCIGDYLGINITRWNDDVCKSKEEAVAKLRELAEIC
jgi:hypothetical protein